MQLFHCSETNYSNPTPRLQKMAKLKEAPPPQYKHMHFLVLKFASKICLSEHQPVVKQYKKVIRA